MNLEGFKIGSGGRTVADRAALDFAIRNGIEHGGWCPKGRRSKDDTIPGKYQPGETAAAIISNARNVTRPFSRQKRRPEVRLNCRLTSRRRSVTIAA
jgi:hypothetical protein